MSETRVNLTGPQAAALRVLSRRPYLSRGEDGCTTAVIRRLQAMGLVMVSPAVPRPGEWTAALTVNGRRRLAEIGNRERS